MEQRFFKCPICGQIIAKVKQTAVPVMCCGKAMEEILPNTVDASAEKHTPAYSVENNIVTVNVGDVAHPMIAEHYIEWVSIQTKTGNQRKCLSPESSPIVTFAITPGDEVVCVYAYCNLHGLWKK